MHQPALSRETWQRPSQATAARRYLDRARAPRWHVAGTTAAAHWNAKACVCVETSDYPLKKSGISPWARISNLFSSLIYLPHLPGGKQIVRSTEKKDDLELTPAKLVTASVIHHGELRCLSPSTENFRQPYWHICQEPAPDRDKWTNSGTQSLIQSASNNQDE